MEFTMLKAWVVGFLILLFANLLWTLGLKFDVYPMPLSWIVWLFPAVAAFAVAYFAPHKKIILGISMAPCGAILTTVLNFLYDFAGMPVDFPGLEGAAIVFTVTIISNAVLCAIGCVLASFNRTQSIKS